MQQQGKVRFISISTTLPHLPTYLKWGVFDTFQIPYSALERDHEDWISQAAEAGIGTIIRGGVARGEAGVGLGSGDRWRKFEQAGLDDLRENIAAAKKGPLPADVYAEAKRRLEKAGVAPVQTV